MFVKERSTGRRGLARYVRTKERAKFGGLEYWVIAWEGMSRRKEGKGARVNDVLYCPAVEFNRRFEMTIE